MPDDLRLHLAPQTERDEQIERGTAIGLLFEMTERWGIERVHRWLTVFAAREGKDICR